MMRCLLLACVWVLASAGPVHAGVLFFGGAESGAFENLALNGTGQAADQTHVHTGAYAWKVTNAGNLIALFDATTLYTRFYLYPLANPAARVVGFYCQANSALTQFGICLGLTTAGKLTFTYNLGSDIATGTTALTLNAWNLIEVKAVRHASAGGLEAKLNGTVEFTSFSTNTTTVSVGRQEWGGWSAGGFWFDDVLLRDDAYPGGGQSIMRRGINQTPTYDAWSKTGGVRIDQAWNDTPVGGATATSSTANAAQTMAIHPFSTVESGHGTEVILAGATINACVTFVYGNPQNGGGSHGWTVRRRIGGVDTDFTTAAGDNAFYYGQFFTDSPSNLGSYEAGVVHDSGSTAAVAVDAGMACDYIPGPSAVRHRVNMSRLSIFGPIQAR
jgi:hypothetical protein